MKNKIPKFSLCIHYKDDDTCEKKPFQSKQLALDCFETFKRINKRPVTVTFYCGVVPYWVYYKS